MALRREDLQIGREAAVLEFPTAIVRARAARRQRAVFARRRLTAALTIVIVVALGTQIGGVGNSVPASTAGAPKTIRLEPGETLWDVAARFAPASIDTRAYVDELIELNDLSGAPAAGVKIRLPKSS
ncbi:MAG: LysM peptidoglycan-binding domain-containing protein [Actinomycetota bacterium]